MHLGKESRRLCNRPGFDPSNDELLLSEPKEGLEKEGLEKSQKRKERRVPALPLLSKRTTPPLLSSFAELGSPQPHPPRHQSSTPYTESGKSIRDFVYPGYSRSGARPAAESPTPRIPKRGTRRLWPCGRGFFAPLVPLIRVQLNRFKVILC